MTKIKELEGIDEYLVEACKRWNAPGCAVVILKDNKVAYCKGIGNRDISNKLEWTTQTLHAIASSTKSFTATAIAMMVEDGILEWDRPIRDYVSEFKLKDPMASNNTTIVDILCHRTGLPSHSFIGGNDEFEFDKIFEHLQHLEFTKPFRTTFQYSNLLYAAIAKIIEEISGMSYGKFLSKRIFKPLRMKNSTLSFRELKESPDHAVPYDENLEENWTPDVMHDISSAGGGIISSIDDIGKWIKFNLDKGKARGKQLVTAENLVNLYHPLFIFPGTSGNRPDRLFWYQGGYGLGWQSVIYRGEKMVFHGGGYPGYDTQVRFFPDRNIGLGVFVNKNFYVAHGIVYDLIDRMLGFEPHDWVGETMENEARMIQAMQQAKEALKGITSVGPKPTRSLGEYVGKFHHPGYGSLKVILEDNSLLIQFGSLTYPLTHYQYDTFHFAIEVFEFSAFVTFQFDTNGEVHGFTANVEEAIDPVLFKMVPDERMWTEEFLERMTGKYSFMEEIVEIKLKGEDTLILTHPHRPPQDLSPIRKMRFDLTGTGATITFVEDDTGKITEFQFSAGGGFFAQLITAKRIEED